jgi:hypothetical protein
MLVTPFGGGSSLVALSLDFTDLPSAPKLGSPPIPGGFLSEKFPSRAPSPGGSSTSDAFGGDGVPSPPIASFVMVKIGWFHGARRTNSRRKWTTDRTKNYNLNLSNCETFIFTGVSNVNQWKCEQDNGVVSDVVCIAGMVEGGGSMEGTVIVIISGTDNAGMHCIKVFSYGHMVLNVCQSNCKTDLAKGTNYNMIINVVQ